MSDNEQRTKDKGQRTAFVFPGQGSQAVGMGKDLFDNFAVAKQTFEEADDALGFKLSEMCFAGSVEDLALTENTQPAILTVSVAAFRAAVSQEFPTPAVVAGHSLGEYSALVAAGAMSFTDAVRTVRQRGRFMQEAVPQGVGAMAAILGADLAAVETVCREAASGEVCSPANINSPGQIVIAGHAAAVNRAIELLKTRGAKRAVLLNVSAPFHCALMLPAQQRLANTLQNIAFKDLQTPLVQNVDAQPNDDREKITDALVRQVSSPVRWSETVDFLINSGVTTFVEFGAGKVLSGLIRQTNRDSRCLNVEDVASLTVTQAELRN